MNVVHGQFNLFCISMCVHFICMYIPVEAAIVRRLCGSDVTIANMYEYALEGFSRLTCSVAYSCIIRSAILYCRSKTIDFKFILFFFFTKLIGIYLFSKLFSM